VSPGSEEVAAETSGGKSLPRLRNIAGTAAISSEENANFGREHGRIFLEDLLRETGMQQTLMDREQGQRLVARGREKAAYDNIGIDDRPDHFTPQG
jgi:hypothetical protein